MWIGDKLFPKKKKEKKEDNRLQFFSMDSFCLCFPELHELLEEGLIEDDDKREDQ